MADFQSGFSNVLKNTDMQHLKAYVTAPGKLGANQAESTVMLHVTHSNLKAEFMEIRFDKHVRQYHLTACT
jgi:tubulin-specific chaperone B